MIYIGIYNGENEIYLFLDENTRQPVIFSTVEDAENCLDALLSQNVFATIIFSKIPLGKAEGGVS